MDRKYFEEIGLLDEGMEIYGGENVELGIRVSGNRDTVHLQRGILGGNVFNSARQTA